MKKTKICLAVLFSLFLMSAAGCSSSKEILLGTSASEETVDEDPDSSAQESEETADTGAESDTSGADADAAGEDLICVYICGAVKEPGVYTMQAGDRICDLVEAAGGLTGDADEAAVNQAEVLSDEQMVYIYSVDEDAEIAAGSSSGSSASGESEKVNINTADAAELTTLSGIGEAKAESIIAYREENGDFSSIEEIMNVNGIKEGIYAQIKDDICV